MVRKLWLNVALMGLTLLVCEALLSLGAAASPRLRYLLEPPATRAVDDDPVRGFRLSPYFPDHDERGYRNVAFPTQTDVLAIGDSYTYGYAAPLEGAWPYHLRTMIGADVYNGGVGGYGPCEYEVVLDDLLMLNPKLVIVGVHPGNDLGDAYRSVYSDRRCPHLRSTDPARLAELDALDSQATIAQRAEELGWEIARELPDAPFGMARLRRWISLHSSLYGLVRSARYSTSQLTIVGVAHSADDIFARDSARPFRLAYSAEPALQTVFKNPDMLALTVDQADPRIQEGLRITESVLLSMRNRLQDRGIRLVVALIMDKTTVYAPLLRERGDVTMPEGFYRLAALEEAVGADLKRFLEANTIEVVETSDSVRSHLNRGVQAYPESDDHHPNSVGYRAVAEAIAAYLERHPTQEADRSGS